MSVLETSRELLEQIQCGPRNERKKVVEQLRALRSVEAIPAYIDALTNVGRSRKEAIRALIALGAAASAAIEPLSAVMIAPYGTPSYRVKDMARKALVAIGDASIPTLVVLLEHEDPFVRRRAARALGDIGNQRGYQSVLSRFLATPAAPLGMRRALAYALGRCGGVEEVDHALVAEAAGSYDWTRNAEIAKSMRVLALECPLTGSLLSQRLSYGFGLGLLQRCQQRRAKDDPSMFVEAIEHFLQRDEPLSHEDAVWVQQLLRCLVYLTPTNAAPLMRKQLESHALYTRELFEALGAIGDGSVLPTLVAYIKTPQSNPDHHAACLRAIGSIGGNDATRFLVSMLRDTFWSRQAAVALHCLPKYKLYPEERFALLRELLSHQMDAHVWEGLCAYLSRWPENDQKQLAIEYVEQHIDVPDHKRLVPVTWWYKLSKWKAPDTAWSLVRHLHVDGGMAREEVVARLSHPKLAGLTCLTLHRVGFNRECVNAIAGLPQLEGVTHLDLSDNPIGYGGVQVIVEQPFFAQLQQLKLHSAGFAASGMKLLQGSEALAGVDVQF